MSKGYKKAKYLLIKTKFRVRGGHGVNIITKPRFDRMCAPTYIQF